MGQILNVLNVIVEQQRVSNKKQDDIVKAIAATNKRLTENTVVQVRLERKVDQLLSERATANVAEPIAQVQVTPADIENIPSEFALGSDLLDTLRRTSTCPGHFAAQTLPTVFPELFGPDQLRLLYNWDGKLNKRPLDDARKAVVTQYTLFFYPESRHAWKDVKDRINERLRRKVKPPTTKKTRKTQPPREPADEPADVSADQLAENEDTENIPPQDIPPENNLPIRSLDDSLPSQQHQSPISFSNNMPDFPPNQSFSMDNFGDVQNVSFGGNPNDSLFSNFSSLTQYLNH